MKFPEIDIPRKPEIIRLRNDINFLTLFEKLEQDFGTCFFLESLGEQSINSRYSVIGFEPEAIIVAHKNQLTWFDKKNQITIETKNPYYYLANWFPKNILSKIYSGGLVGYLGYDAMTYFEPVLKLSLHPDFPQFMFGLYLDGLVYDTMTGETFYFFIKKIE